MKVQMMSKDLTISAVTAHVCSEEGAVRLVGGPTEKEGRVEIMCQPPMGLSLWFLELE